MKFLFFATPHQKSILNMEKNLLQDYRVATVPTLPKCLHYIKTNRPDILFIDISLLETSESKNNYLDVLKKFWNLYPSLEIIALVHMEEKRQAVKLVKAGVQDFMTYPIDPDELKIIVESVKEKVTQQGELEFLRKEFIKKNAELYLGSESPAMKEVYEKVRKVAQTVSTVLILGETGTGKGVLARIIHELSSRREKPFIPVHCGAITETLLESELFGHEKGAFTSAVRQRLGKFEIADKGTIFLDEIGAISSAVQIALLNVIQEKSFQRVGGYTTIKTDVRIISATNTDLLQSSHNGQFRSDLFYRLNVFPIEIPPLRERSADIVSLVETFVRNLNKIYLNKIERIHPEVLEAVQVYNWPGNIRELQNVVERAYIIESSSELTPKGFPIDIFHDKIGKIHPSIDISQKLDAVRKNALEKTEQEYLVQQLIQNKGKINATATASGISERQLLNLMNKYHLHKEDYKIHHSKSTKSEI